MNNNCKTEVLELHAFFEDWFNARLPDTYEIFSRVQQALSPDFLMITPEAQTVHCKKLLKDLRSMHGLYKDDQKPSAIWIDNLQVRQLSDALCLVTYEEWQEKKDQTEKKGRLSTALFEEYAMAPSGVRWIHLHETWIR